MKEQEEKILALKSGEKIFISQGNESGIEIWRINHVYLIFSIPLFGGEPVYENTFFINESEQMFKELESWT